MPLNDMKAGSAPKKDSQNDEQPPLWASLKESEKNAGPTTAGSKRSWSVVGSEEGGVPVAKKLPRGHMRVGRRREKRKCQVCIPCHNRKVKCDRGKPHCGNCERAGIAGTCYYEKPADSDPPTPEPSESAAAAEPASPVAEVPAPAPPRSLLPLPVQPPEPEVRSQHNMSSMAVHPGRLRRSVVGVSSVPSAQVVVANLQQVLLNRASLEISPEDDLGSDNSNPQEVLEEFDRFLEKSRSNEPSTQSRPEMHDHHDHTLNPLVVNTKNLQQAGDEVNGTPHQLQEMLGQDANTEESAQPMIKYANLAAEHSHLLSARRGSHRRTSADSMASWIGGRFDGRRTSVDSMASWANALRKQDDKQQP